MVGFENGSITLDEERNTYYAGQVLSGRIEFAITQPLVFTAIKVEFHGEANVKWRKTNYDEQTAAAYTGHEEYFNVVQCVCGGIGVSQLAAGSHSIPFRFQIPPTTPSFLDGRDRVGGVSFYVKACLEFPDGRVKANKLKEPFIVVVPLDLNVNPEMGRPIEFQFKEVIGSCFCGDAGAVSVRAHLPASGYCPAQRVPVRIHADNQSPVEIHKIVLELVQREKFHSQNPRSDHFPPDQSLAVVKRGPVPKRTACRISCELVVPDMIAPVLDNCGLVDVEFFFKVKLKLSGCQDDLESETQIWLGFVPLSELTLGQYTHPLQSYLPKGPIPDLNAPPEIIIPYIYPSVTLENKMEPVSYQNVNHPGADGYTPQGNPYPSKAYPGNVPGDPPYPCPNAPYHDNTPYAGTRFPYPGSNSPKSNSSYPGPYPPYPDAYSGAPYPTNPPPYSPSPAPIGFTAPPGYPTGAVPTAPNF